MLPDVLERQGLSLNLLSKLVMPVGVDRGAKGPWPPKFLEHIVILYFERRFSKQNSVIRLKSDILAPPNFFAHPKFLGWLRHWLCLDP